MAGSCQSPASPHGECSPGSQIARSVFLTWLSGTVSHAGTAPTVRGMTMTKCKKCGMASLDRFEGHPEYGKRLPRQAKG